ncbi:5-formyltetrahydrofolate cyclo-ligase [Yarrowia lipolytica]|jgi:5-formyltetrahydrofolate cyclo-ligase|uniref:5-formyltetrahydrofolate cyclo-ligase n=3 Tax=Yarrowia lipolytica TaxID=4952 RepID=Q6CAN2_YARLI|nr:YALI0D01309p [Yarrowia lipolytica CLIB122]KAB8282550.1 5-formyltetrahydrofolate cyclo-ligase [Yarrowia lipolytica]KAE8173200.1 5-formyltetrahydrofolate cyclo-ligase [Yarrowia lipolytica]KAJ8054922.1 5-formyltetrahydrofolate cyclo-ligase [Yarrowia lipolytica]QNP97584.1 5-formyltetrahydrofolate cyclo-ligase [Yarrowia lipolytica]RDW26265.1 5-formyltetrahydrofolate cyclo-ligase [Yarrowia lipolytica]|eukprot:XP_502280.1 YALI0D01309p [Yarrowia lipolytica CLIB122]
MSKPAKQQLRKLIAQRVADVSKDSIQKQSLATTAALRTLNEYKSAQNIAFYMNMDSGELETMDMIRNAFEDKKRVFLPRIEKLADTADKIHPCQKSELRMLEIVDFKDVQNLQPRGPYKLKEPTKDAKDVLESGGLGLIVLPGVAMTPQCARLGHGVGFYDAYIHKHEKLLGVPKLVGVCLREQLVDELPLEEHDRLLDVVVSGASVYRKVE